MGKGSKPIIGFHYRPAFHHGLTIEIDAFLEMRGGDRTAWRGELTASGTISINAPHLFGGEKDQGGMVGDVDVMFGEPTQAVNSYLQSTFGDQVPAWRGFTTVVWKGGRYGAMNPYPQKASYKVRRILQGWDGGVAWYPEKAAISLGVGTPHVIYTDLPLNAMGAAETPVNGVTIDNLSPSDVVSVEVIDGVYEGWSRWPSDDDPAGEGLPWECSFTVTDDEGVHQGYFPTQFATAAEALADATTAGPVLLTGSTSYTFWLWDDVLSNRGGVSLRIIRTPTGSAINPAHVLYDSRTCSDMGREPTANINPASLQAAADQLYAEGFGICPKWDPSSESVEDFEQRICRLIGGSFTRSLEDGQWYLDLARGDYVLEDLPILTDDDILDFKEQPSTLDSAVNSVSVRYFDPERKETIVTPPVRALGLVAAFGVIHQTLDFPEIPTSGLALRVAMRELLAFTTPTRAFDLVTTRRTYAWRPNKYFRMQTSKRGIADMVCLVGEKQSGTLKSGAIRMKATQDIYSLPATSFVEVEPGVDPSPDQTPTAITLQRAEEAPYIEVVASLSRADLDALPADAGFAMAIATTTSTDLDFTMLVDPAGSGYEEIGRGEWCASATVVEDAVGPSVTALTLANGFRLDQVEIGMPVLWDDELCRVDAIDVGASTISLGRGCGDTVPAPTHEAGSRLWFYQTGFAYDATEYTDGESIAIKLLSNTGSQQVLEAAATAMSLTFDQRQARPYPPGLFRINGFAYPTELAGSTLAASWAHRDRELQADQLLDETDASVGPEAGTTYTLEIESPPGSVVYTEAGISGTASTPFEVTGTGPVRMTLKSVRDGLDSRQACEHTFTWTGDAAYLDALAVQPQAVVWLKKLVSTATLSIRVRRSTDNVESDIGFDGDVLDTVALLSFASGATCYVTKMYDQTLNGNDLVFSVTSQQPRIVNAGVYDGALVWDGTDDAGQITGVTMGTPYAAYFTKLKLPDGTGPDVVVESSTDYNSNVGALVLYMDSNNFSIGTNGGTAYRREFNPSSITSLTAVGVICQMAVADGTLAQQRMRVAGVELTAIGTQGAPATVPQNFGTYNWFFGARSHSSLYAPLHALGHVIYNSDVTGLEADIEALL